jgi:outer membrane protein assembly factor BamB
LLGSLALAVGAFAQSGGELLWSVNLANTPATAAPKVAPSGDIYIHSDDLYAISPSGQIIWSNASSDPKTVDLGADGTVYSGAGGTIFAYTPAGQLIWSFTEPPGGQGLMAGPTVGPDGNIYAVSDGGGLGAFSLTPGRPASLESARIREFRRNWHDASSRHCKPPLLCGGCRAGMHRL